MSAVQQSELFIYVKEYEEECVYINTCSYSFTLWFIKGY